MNARRCAVCQGTLVERFGQVRDPETGEQFAILQCTSCGLGHTDPVPADLARYYGEAYHGTRHGITDQFCAQRRLRLLNSHASRPGRLLDIGCGDGTFLETARVHGWDVVGTEQVGATHRASAKGIEIRSDLKTLAGSTPFDAATLWHSLEHVADPLGTLVELRTMLHNNAVLIVAVPDSRGLQARLFGDRWFHLDVPRHLYHFDNRSLSSLLSFAGFQIQATRSCEFEYDLFGWVQSALDRVISEPRVLFHRLTGKPLHAGWPAISASLAIGALSGAAALPLTLYGAKAGGGGTLIVVAKPLAESTVEPKTVASR